MLQHIAYGRRSELQKLCSRYWKSIDLLEIKRILVPPTTGIMCAAQDLSSDCLSQLLNRWNGGDQEALKSLVPLVYAELRRLAHNRLRYERQNHTLQTTALVHEAYLRLAENPPNKVADRKHFLALAASIMRQVLVDHAREKLAQKRDGGVQIELDSKIAPVPDRVLDVLAINEALTNLAKLDPRQCTIVELRFFAGMSIEDTAAIMGMSPATVKRDWITARAWLFQQMTIAAQSKAAGATHVG